MNSVRTHERPTKPFILTKRVEEILRTIRFYRFMAAADVAQLMFSPRSLTHVRSLLSTLAGGADYAERQYLFRFQLPSTSTGNSEKIYTLGSKGRDFVANELGLPVDWYFRPYKTRHLSYSQVAHNLTLSRFLVAAHSWSAMQSDFKLAQTRICYDLAREAMTFEISKEGKTERLKVIPDAWLLFEQLKDGRHAHWFPVLLEVDRGMEYQQKFKQHVRSRIEFIKKGGAYSKMFGTEAVVIAYVTTGQTPEYRDTRRAAMCAWTNEVLAKLNKENWARLFRFCSVTLDLYSSQLFKAPVWYKPDSASPVPLFTF